jgi:hypothetical protein
LHEVLSTELGTSLYRRRQQLIEPVFANTKHNRGIDRFHRRGRAAVRTEWRLITATHNLLKTPPPPDRHRLTEVAGAAAPAARLDPGQPKDLRDSLTRKRECGRSSASSVP